MKRIISIILVALSALVIAATTLPPSLTLSVSASGNANTDEKRAMNIVIDAYNVAQFAANTNFVFLSRTNNTDRRASYMTVLSARINAEHAADVVKYGAASSSGYTISGDDMDIIIRSVIDRLQGGETIQQIETDLATP